LSRESLKKRQIDELWKARRATSPASLAQVLVSDPVAEAIRKELWRQTGHRGSTRPRSSGCSATRCFAPAAFEGKVPPSSCVRRPLPASPGVRRRPRGHAIECLATNLILVRMPSARRARSLARLIPGSDPCMPYTDLRPDHGRLRLSSCGSGCPLGTVIDRC
jgi:hypothetical protein